MRSETANRMLSETSEETKQKVRETANRLVMENKLISMVDFVLSKSNLWVKDESKHSDLNFIQSVCRYAEFISLPLKLGMFVPCDENDVPLVEPKDYDDILLNGSRVYHYEDIVKANQYQQAKDCVLFEGFELVESHENWFTVKIVFDDFSEQLTVSKQETIEDLLTYSFNPEFYLTASAIKQF